MSTQNYRSFFESPVLNFYCLGSPKVLISTTCPCNSNVYAPQAIRSYIESLNSSLKKLLPMTDQKKKVNEINKKLTDKKLVAPVISSEIDMSKAVELLRKQGVSEKDINEGLSVPVFFSKPFITVNTPKGTKAVFFLSYNDAAAAAAKITGTKVELLAADLTVALGRMIETKNDEFVFYPTPAFFKLMQEQGQSGAKNP